MSVIRRHPLAAFFVIAFAISWACWLGMAAAGASVTQGSAWPTHVPGLLGPALAAIAVAVAIGGGRALLRRTFLWRVSWRWYAVALTPLAFYAVAAPFAGGFDLAALGRFSGLPAVAAPVLLAMLLVTAFAEEIGWRGFALPMLLEKRNLLGAAGILGVIWAVWHLPLFLVIANYRDLGVAVLPMFFLSIIGGSVFLAWLYRASGGSVLILAIWHATYDLVSGTAAAHGAVAAFVTTAVMVWASAIVIRELWLRMHSGSSRTAHSPS